MAGKNRKPPDEQMELARRADAKRRYSEEGPSGMSFLQAQTPIRYLAAKLMEGRDRRAFERNQPRIRAEAAEIERQLTDSLSRNGYAKGGCVIAGRGGKYKGAF